MVEKNKTTGRQGQLTNAEVAMIPTGRGPPVNAKIVWHLERQTLKKLATDPTLMQRGADLAF
jgi:hypothetical protein